MGHGHATPTWLLAALAVGCAHGGCAGPRGAGVAGRPLLAVFDLRPHKVRLARGQLAALQAHATRLVELVGAYRAVPHAQLRAKLDRRRRRAERSCRDLRCQARLAPRLFGAHKSLSVEVNERMLAQCEVVATIYDLDQQSIDHHARTTTSCAPGELVAAVSRVVCHLSRNHRRGLATIGFSPGRRGRRGRRRAKAPTPPAARAAASCLATGEVAWLDERLEAWTRSRRPNEEQAEAAEGAIELRRAYEQLARSRFAAVSVAATCRTGTVYDRLADRLTSGPAQAPAAVRRLGAAAVAQHRKQQGAAQSRRAAPFREQARKRYRRCLARAKALKVGGHHVEQARHRLSVLDRYARLDR